MIFREWLYKPDAWSGACDFIHIDKDPIVIEGRTERVDQVLTIASGEHMVTFLLYGYEDGGNNAKHYADMVALDTLVGVLTCLRDEMLKDGREIIEGEEAKNHESADPNPNPGPVRGDREG